MYQVVDGKIVRRALPTTGYLSDGRGVSNYHMLDSKTLADEGWLPTEEVKPNFDPATERLFGPTEEIFIDRVVLTWVVYMIPEPEPEQPSELEKRIEEIEMKLQITQDALVSKEVLTVNDLVKKETFDEAL